MANTITGIRIICGIALLFCPVFSVLFYGLYIAAGLTDMIDGPIARKTNTVSRFGSGLDTAADLIFTVVCLIRLIPVLNMTAWMYIWAAVIAAIKVTGMIWGYAAQKRLVSVHSVMNKVTGALLFALPLTVGFIELKYSAVLVCTAATAAAVSEGYLVVTGTAWLR